MAIPIVFQAKAMTVRLLISTTFFLVIAAILLVSFDSTTVKVSNYQEIKNDTLVLGKEIQEPLVILIPGGAVEQTSLVFGGSGGGPYTGVSNGIIIRWRANDSRWVGFAVTSPER